MTATLARGGSSNDQGDIRFLIEKNADGIIVVDDEGVVLFVNPAAEQIFGRPAPALIGSPIGIPFLAGETTEISIRRPEGDQVDAEIRVVDTVWNHRHARMASLRDVSARRAMEERLRHSAKMEAVGRLTAGIAHDFNNLLTVVLGNLESAQRQSALAEGALLRALDNATRGARRAAGLTGRLLAFARRKPLEPRLVDVNALVEGMSDLLQRTLAEEIRVRTVLAADLWRTAVDPIELEATILNLAVNARDAMPSGGTLVIETANAELDADYAAANADVEPGRYVQVTVADSGSGMTAEVLKQVFEPFFTTKGGRGTGLGLSQVYGFVRQSGGHVKLYSEPGLGTTAKLYLPTATEGAAVAPHPAADARAHDRVPHGVESILVVEDDNDVRAYAVGSLRELGYTVFEAADGVSAIRVLEREPSLQLLFTDLGLPNGIDGKALASHARDIRPGMPTIITTAYAAGALMHDGRLESGVELLNKPFSYAALATKIREVLDRSGKQTGPARVLVVEDEALVRMLVVETLAGLGCRVEEAANFTEAIAKFDKLGDALSAAVIDLGLPDRPGDQLAMELRTARADLPIILATGYGSDAVPRRLQQDERLKLLRKPFNPDEMAAVLRQLGVLGNVTA